MNPIMKWIYLAYFHMDTYSIFGISGDAKLISALQVLSHKYSVEMRDPWNPINAHDHIVINSALSFVRKYSTCKNP